MPEKKGRPRGAYVYPGTLGEKGPEKNTTQPFGVGSKVQGPKVSTRNYGSLKGGEKGSLGFGDCFSNFSL